MPSGVPEAGRKVLGSNPSAFPPWTRLAALNDLLEVNLRGKERVLCGKSSINSLSKSGLCFWPPTKPLAFGHEGFQEKSSTLGRRAGVPGPFDNSLSLSFILTTSFIWSRGGLELHFAVGDRVPGSCRFASLFDSADPSVWAVIVHSRGGGPDFFKREEVMVFGVNVRSCRSLLSQSGQSSPWAAPPGRTRRTKVGQGARGGGSSV